MFVAEHFVDSVAAADVVEPRPLAAVGPVGLLLHSRVLLLLSLLLLSPVAAEPVAAEPVAC